MAPAAARGRAAHVRAGPARLLARRPARRGRPPTGSPSCVADAVAVLDALGVDAGARGRPRLGRDRRLGAGRRAPRPGAHADRGLGAAPGGHRRTPWPHDRRAEGRARRTWRCSASRAWPSRCCWRGTRRRCARLLGGRRRRARVGPYAEPMREPGALTAALNWYRAMSGGDLAGVGPVTVPTTYVWSDRDVAIGRTAAEACAAHASAATTASWRCPGVSHWIPDEAPAALAEAILGPGRRARPEPCRSAVARRRDDRPRPSVAADPALRSPRSYAVPGRTSRLGACWCTPRLRAARASSVAGRTRLVLALRDALGPDGTDRGAHPHARRTVRPGAAGSNPPVPRGLVVR